MERRIPFKDRSAQHIEVLNGGITVTVTASVNHVVDGRGIAAAVKHTTIVNQCGRPIVTIGPRVLKLKYFGTRPKYIGTYSLSINRQKFEIGFAGKAFYEDGAIPKYLYVRIEQD